MERKGYTFEGMAGVFALLGRKQVAMPWGEGKALEEVAHLGSLVHLLSQPHLKGHHGVLGT